MTTESVLVYHTKQMGHIVTTTYHSISGSPQQQDERVEREE
jgi:hypothetical protein